MTYRLHFAPDNASLIIRMALEHIGAPYETVLVDRAAKAQQSPGYLALNPNGLIPVLETPQGALFETGAILLWLVDQHDGLGPMVAHNDRGDFLKWLFFLSNTLHPALRMLFYTDKYITGEDEITALQTGTQANIKTHLDRLDTLLGTAPSWLGAPDPTAADFYLMAQLRWLGLYPKNLRGWFTLADWPKLDALAERRDAEVPAQRVAAAEGLGPTPFSNPTDPNPPEGSAL